MREDEQKKVSALPIIFCLLIVIISVLNLTNFYSILEKDDIEDGISLQKKLASVEGEYAENFVGVDNYIDLNGAFARIINQSELNEIVKLNNNHLIQLQQENHEWAVGNLKENHSFISELKKPYIYIETPKEVPSDNDVQIPYGYETYVNRNADKILQELHSADINYLDLREKFNEDGEEGYSLYYTTDHHWTNEAAFKATKYVVECIAEQLPGIYIDKELFDEDNYYKKEINYRVLGSHGRKTGMYFSEADKINYYIPKEKYEIELVEPRKEKSISGDFQSVLLNADVISGNQKLLGPEIIYLGGNIEYRKIVNKNAMNNNKIMLINDSFSLPLAPFLALHFEEIHMYDAREQFGGSAESFKMIIDQVNPDIVIQLNTRFSIVD